MALNCLAGCVPKYKAGPLKLPPEGHTLSPWVRLQLEKSGALITVGNKSSPQNDHNAIIKAFEFGQTDGFTAKFTIHDQQGSSFVQFMKDLIKKWEDLKVAAALTMKVQWGWVRTGCPTPLPELSSPIHTMMPDHIECNFSQGKFMFDITAKDIPFRMLEGRTEKCWVEDGQKLPLKKAIKAMMTNNKEPPTVKDVKWQRISGGKPVEIGFKEFGMEGPEDCWKPQGRDKLSCAKAWIENYPSDGDKGWTMAYDSVNQVIIFWEDGIPVCGECKPWDSNSIGTYIVNGGACSPVIEFNPRIRWNFADLLNDGGAVDAGTNYGDEGRPGGKNKGDIQCDTKAVIDKNHTAGVNKNTTVDDTAKNLRGTKEAQKKNDENASKDAKANRLLHHNIEADLVIVGDPTLLPPSEGIWIRNLAIVFINPFHIMKKGTCGEWLAQPECNEVLSNKAWICKKITHKISPGHYTTTISVFLAASGVDLSTCEPIGGECSEGWAPCS
jgi:hypothetical protein